MWVSGDRSSYRGHDWRFARRLARLLPPITYVVDHVQACGRFASRYVSKSRAQRTRRRGVCRREEGRRADGEPLDENQILGDEKYPSLPLEVVAIVARQLHYVDLVNLSRSSKRLRTTFFGAMDPSATMERLREDVCVGKSGQYECGICSMQVCEVCIMTHPDHYVAAPQWFRANQPSLLLTVLGVRRKHRGPPTRSIQPPPILSPALFWVLLLQAVPLQVRPRGLLGGDPAVRLRLRRCWRRTHHQLLPPHPDARYGKTHPGVGLYLPGLRAHAW